MKILKATQIRALDAYTIEHEPISSLDLMERASLSMANWLRARYSPTQKYAIFAGNGNNGGDGLALARILAASGGSVSVYYLDSPEKQSSDFRTNLERLKNHLKPMALTDENPSIAADEIIIDALYGTGMSRPIEGRLAGLIIYLNNSERPIISIDIASGLFADGGNSPTDIIITPGHTVTFQLPKLAFMLPENAPFVGRWHVVDIGASREFVINEPCDLYFTLPKAVDRLVSTRPKFAHKGFFGHALMVAGSQGKMGAAVLAAKACLRGGVGLLTVNIPSNGETVLLSSVPEAMLSAIGGKNSVSKIPFSGSYSAVGIGPGLGKANETVRALKKFLSAYKEPLLLDADALNILAENQALLKKLPEQTILTPHVGEFDRMAGTSKNGSERLVKLIAFAKKHRVVVCLKGAHTAVAFPNGEVHFNSTGNPGMATAGSGDVLSGVITALLARGMSATNAAILGVFRHGQAGDRAAEIRSEESLIASDIIDQLR